MINLKPEIDGKFGRTIVLVNDGVAYGSQFLWPNY